jgi:hypothetical protein
MKKQHFIKSAQMKMEQLKKICSKEKATIKKNLFKWKSNNFLKSAQMKKQQFFKICSNVKVTIF